MKIHTIHPGLIDISENYRGILFDAYGVFWGGNAFGELPGAKEVMEKLVAEGKCVGILSNATQLSDKEIEKVKRHGIQKGKHFHFYITSGEICRSLFLHEELPFPTPRKTFFLFGGAHPRFSSHEAIFRESRFREVDKLDEADFIYISVPHKDGEDQTDPELFREAVEKIAEWRLPMVCPNPDQFAHEGSPPQAVVRQGTIASLYEKMGGEVFYIGKPHKKVYQKALEQFVEFGVCQPSEVLMVGDTPETDIRGAKQLGMRTALVVRTGIMADRIDQKGFERSMAELSTNDLPDYLLESVAYAKG